MRYHELNLSSKKQPKRAGRGISAGRGKTAGRGTKGQLARAGSSRKPGFEGGQNPLLKRIPKLPGFTSIRPKALNVTTGQINKLSAKTIDNFALYDSGLVDTPYAQVKVISKGNITKKCSVKLQGASDSAVAAIQKAGGSFEKVPRVERQKKATKDNTKA